MERAKTLLDKAAKATGSFYALSKDTGIPQSNMTNVMQGKRKMPMEWVPLLAEIAGGDVTTELALILAEQLPEESRGRAILEKWRATNAAAMLLFSLIVAVSLSPGPAFSKGISAYQLDKLYIVEDKTTAAQAALQERVSDVGRPDKPPAVAPAAGERRRRPAPRSRRKTLRCAA